MKVTLNVDNCRECHYSTNNALEHDCAFTSGPSTIYWWCKKTHNDIEDPWIIDPSCPFLKQRKQI